MIGVVHVPLESSIDGDLCMSKTGNGHDYSKIPLKISGSAAAAVARIPKGIKSAKSLPEIGWLGGGEWIEFEVEEGHNLTSTKMARIKTRAKRERREQIWQSDWEPGFRARTKAIALANEVLRDLTLETTTTRCDGTGDVLP